MIVVHNYMMTRTCGYNLALKFQIIAEKTEKKS